MLRLYQRSCIKFSKKVSFGSFLSRYSSSPWTYLTHLLETCFTDMSGIFYTHVGHVSHMFHTHVGDISHIFHFHYSMFCKHDTCRHMIDMYYTQCEHVLSTTLICIMHQVDMFCTHCRHALHPWYACLRTLQTCIAHIHRTCIINIADLKK